MMKLQKHLIWIGVLFSVNCGLFYILFGMWFLPNKRWNDRSMMENCTVAGNSIVEAMCNSVSVWYHSGAGSDDIKCYDGIAAVRYINTTLNFEVVSGGFDQVNNTISTEYFVGTPLECLVQTSNSSDFRLHPKPETQALIVSIVVPGLIALVLGSWGICAYVSKKRNISYTYY